MPRWARGSWGTAEPTAAEDVDQAGCGLGLIPGLPEPRLLEALLRFEQAHRRQSPRNLRACFHDEALVESVASRGQALGPDETVEALMDAFRDGVYSIRDWRHEEIAPQVVVSSASARRLIGDARMRDEAVCWLHVGRDGLIWRVKLFRSREEALKHLEQHGPTLELQHA